MSTSPTNLNLSPLTIPNSSTVNSAGITLLGPDQPIPTSTHAPRTPHTVALQVLRVNQPRTFSRNARIFTFSTPNTSSHNPTPPSPPTPIAPPLSQTSTTAQNLVVFPSTSGASNDASPLSSFSDLEQHLITLNNLNVNEDLYYHHSQ